MAYRLAAPDVFGPLNRSTLAEDIAARVFDLIGQKQLRPGDRLPSERRLVATLGVSRPICVGFGRTLPYLRRLTGWRWGFT